MVQVSGIRVFRLYAVGFRVHSLGLGLLGLWYVRLCCFLRSFSLGGHDHRGLLIYFRKLRSKARTPNLQSL